MMDAEYVFCNWKGRLWPAKVLSRSGTSPKSKKGMAQCLEVQILSLDEKIKVKSTEIQMLTKSQMEAMASTWAARSKVGAPSGEERAHRRALKVAQEILEERARSGHSSTFHKEETTSLSQRVPKKTSRALSPRKYGKLTGDVPRSHEKKIEFSKYLVVSLVKCDSLYGDKSQKHTDIGPVPSEVEPKSSPSSRVGHNFPSLAEGSGEKEGKKKAGPSAVTSSHPTVMKEGGCAEHQEGNPIWPSGIVGKGMKAVKKKARNSCPKDLARSPESSACSANMEDPREGPSKPRLTRAATCSSSSHLRLINRKRKLQMQRPVSGLKKGQPVDDSEVKVALEILEERARSGHSSTFHKEETTSLSQRVLNKTSRALPPRKYGKLTEDVPRSHEKKIEFSKYLVVSLVKCDSLYGDKSQKHTDIGPVPSEVEPKSSPSSRVGHNFPSLAEGSGEKEGKKKAGPSAVTSLYPTVMKEGGCAEHQEGNPIWPSGIVGTGLKAMKEEAQDTCPKTLARYPKSSACLENMEDPRVGPSKPRLAGAATGSSSSNLRLANRKRKLQVQGPVRGPKKRQLVGDSEATSPVRSKNRGSRRQGQPARVACTQEPCPIERGTVVWFKFQEYPYWPAVVVSVRRVEKTARVLLIEAYMNQERRGIRVPLRRLKHFDCQQKPKLMKRARKLYGQSVDWCCSLVAHYRESLGRRSFAGSFLEYFAADISYPLRKAIQEGEVEGDFPRVNYNDLEESEEETCLGSKRLCKKFLPDRMKAARDRDNRKLLDFIVKRKGAESHLLDIVNGRKQSTWLDSFLNSTKRAVCVETYLEDEDQLDILVKYLQEIYEQIGQRMLTLIRNDKVNFVLEVLLPEAIICSISALEGLHYKDAEAKYLDGPPVHYREKELFDKKVLWERRRRLTKRKAN
ncbi:PWWP domain-containing DNA repair factor 3B-like [Dugong dugon]